MIGKILAEYRIVEGLGGQAGIEVYKAIGIDGRRPVAIKLFPSNLSHDKLQALLDSLRKLSGLDQPGIPRLIGSGLNGGRAYIIMPFMTGGSLKDRLEIGQISPADALTLLEQIAAALEETHELGVVHGHLSPGEVMFDETGQMQIIGLGQTPFVLNDSDATAESFAGEHVAPEVRSGGQPTPASDQYSVAVLAFELLTGQCVEQALEAAVPETSNEGTASDAGIRLAPEVAEVLQRALQEDPSKRYASVAEMVRALRQAMRTPTYPNGAPLPIAAAARIFPRIRRSVGWGMASLAIVALGCFALTLPAVAAARWMRLELGSIADLLPYRQPGTGPTAISDPRQISLPEISPWISTPTSADRPEALIPTAIRLGDVSQPTQIGASTKDDNPEKPAPTEVSAADDSSEDPQQAETPVPGSASVDGPAGADPTQTIWLTATPNDPQHSSPTPVPPLITATSWNRCSNPAGQGCTDTLPTH
jgi:serine/threonine protein kinase